MCLYVCTLLEGKYLSRILMVLFLSSIQDQMEEGFVVVVVVFLKSLLVRCDFYEPQSRYRPVLKSSRPCLFRLMFTLRGLTMELPEVPKILGNESLIEVNGIYPYPTI